MLTRIQSHLYITQDKQQKREIDHSGKCKKIIRRKADDFFIVRMCSGNLIKRKEALPKHRQTG